MDKSPKNLFLFILSFCRPWSLLSGIMGYAIGGGIIVYLGKPFDWGNYWLGQACVIFFQASSFYLNEYYDLINVNISPLWNKKFDQDDYKRDYPVIRQIFLQVSLTLLSIGVVFAFLLFIRKAIYLPSLIILGMMFGLSLLYSIPPVRLSRKGYGEVADAVLIACLFPAFSYYLQDGEFHRLLAMITFPLTLLNLAGGLGANLPEYARDLKYQLNTLIIRLSWQKTMFLHNLIILIAYLIIFAALLFGLPARLMTPGLFTLPLGAFQIWQMRQISRGAPPRWPVFTLGARSLFILTAYFLAFALWTG